MADRAQVERARWRPYIDVAPVGQAIAATTTPRARWLAYLLRPCLLASSVHAEPSAALLHHCRQEHTVDGEFEGCLWLRDLMDAIEPLTERKRRGKKENRLVTDSGTHISRARMTIYPQTPLFLSWGHPPSQTPPSDSSNSTQS